VSRNRNRKNNKRNNGGEGFRSKFALPEQANKWIGGVIFFLIAIIVTLSFFELSGIAGKSLIAGLTFLMGRAVFSVPLILLISGLVFFSSRYKKFFYPLLLAIFILILGITGILESLKVGQQAGGWVGYLISLSFLKFFGTLVTEIIFMAAIIVSSVIFWQLLRQPAGPKEKMEEKLTPEQEPKTSLIKKIFAPRFKVKEVPGAISEEVGRPEKTAPSELKTKAVTVKALSFPYQMPPLDLLETEKGDPSPGDTRVNAAVIKKTLQNFDISVEMSEINIGPTVTQYSLKPAEGIKLSKITGLSNDLALALAAHPIRIEAPIPGKSLVGIEVPNKVRARVRLRNMIDNPNFQKSPSPLAIALGRDVSGNPVYADLSRMPHLLVAGSTGTGKTIFLNNLMLSLLYRSSPQILRFILIDPKRVEFPVYNELPHLLSPVILDANRSVNAFKWLIGEMERRFDILSQAKSRDIAGFNEKMAQSREVLPYIVVVVDELADLMAAKGKEVEAGIVRLAQMARAVGIHLVVATQRPSVEVITGLIKANITSRITFQVASQIDSRTVLDMAGAERLLGLGDMLYLSAELGKPRRIQSAYVSEKEVRKVTDYIKSNVKYEPTEAEREIFHNHLAEGLEKSLDAPETEFESYGGSDDDLYKEAKRVVVQARKASASLLQRRLRLGYARAARLIDMLEQRGVVGPGEGAKPREVYAGTEEPSEIQNEIAIENVNENENGEENKDWHKV
jgi:S-DNA-T family DNA segregation ATPase FtsK/SpoIIIE